LQVSNRGNIVNCTLVIPEVTTGSKTGDWRNKRFIVNSNINLATWHDVNN
jgi:hypothetical protein